MPAPPRVKAALRAVKNIGFATKDAAPVLKKLLEVYDSNWEYIEENNYQVLIDSILEAQEAKAGGGKGQDSVAGDDPEQYRKRIRKQFENPSSSILGPDGPSETPLKKPKVEADASPEAHLRERREEAVSPHIDNRGRADPVSQQLDNQGKADPVTPQRDNRREVTESTLPRLSSSPGRDEHELSLVNRRETRASARAHKISDGQENVEQDSTLTYNKDKQPSGESPRNLICFKKPKIEPGIEVQQNTEAISSSRPKDKEADDDLQEFEFPIAMIPPEHHLIPAGNEAHQYPQSPGVSSVWGNSSLQANGAESLAAQNSAHNDGKEKGKGTITLKNGKASELVTSQEASSSTIDIASSDRGEVKLMFTFNSDNHPDLRMPSLDAFFKMFEESCLKSYKILQPDFSLQKVMKEMCQFASKLTTEPNDDRKDNIVKLTPALDSVKKIDVPNMLDEMPACSVNGSLNDHCVTEKVRKQENDTSEKRQEVIAPEDLCTSHSLVVVQQPQIALGDLRPPHDPCDITRGEERVRISLVNEVSNEKFPSAFHYIPQNLVYQNAYVNFSLARIGDEDCCADCFGDCLAAAIPCACARDTGGEFAYTSDGLVKKAFLEQCISMYLEPHKHHHVYCQDCPLERSKNGAVPGKCKGHLVRKFIKECWSKCGCSMHCKNRIVQRGITCNLQVFFTPEGKGWGLRTLDELPRGTFVCEYVGEVLTNMELYNRTIQSTGNAKHTYPVLLDADWGSEGVLKDEEALCLDATFYGNVARFVNHRCVDANLVEIPIEVETPDHHYYHLAFFTTRRIERYEELTWDYGIDFDDVGHPVKAFKCRCGSKSCRDVKRSKSRSKALVLK